MANMYEIIEHYYTTHSTMYIKANIGKLQSLIKEDKPMIDTSKISRRTVSKKLQWYTSQIKPFAYKSVTYTDSGYFYCPYVPIMKKEGIINYDAV